MALEHSAEDLKEAAEKARREFRLLDPSWMASRSATTYSYPRRALRVPFFGEEYEVAYPEGTVCRPDGSQAGAREALIILHYLVHAGGEEPRLQWIAYRDLPGARYHEPAFVAEVEGPLSRGLEGRLEALREWACAKARPADVPGDVALVWEVLPRLPLLFIFNDRDEEFPASARVLFDVTAPGYLPTEDLSALAEMAAFRLLEELGVPKG